MADVSAQIELDEHAIPDLIASQLAAYGQNNTGLVVSAPHLKEAISEITLQSTLNACSVLEIVLSDPDWAIQRSGLFQHDQNGLLPPIDIEYWPGTGIYWRLAMIEGTDDLTSPNLTISFIPRFIVYLQYDWGKVSGPNANARGFLSSGNVTTRTQFIQLLTDRIPNKTVALIGPGDDESQTIHLQTLGINGPNTKPIRIPNVKAETATGTADLQAGIEKSPGLVMNPHLTVAGQPITVNQRDNANAILRKGQSLGVSPKAMAAALYAAIGLDEVNQGNVATSLTYSGKFRQLTAGDVSSTVTGTQLHYINMILNIANQLSATPAGTAALMTEAYLESTMGTNMGPNSGGYGGLLAGSFTNGNFSGSPTVDATNELMCKCAFLGSSTSNGRGFHYNNLAKLDDSHLSDDASTLRDIITENSGAYVNGDPAQGSQYDLTATGDYWTSAKELVAKATSGSQASSQTTTSESGLTKSSYADILAWATTFFTGPANPASTVFGSITSNIAKGGAQQIAQDNPFYEPWQIANATLNTQAWRGVVPRAPHSDQWANTWKGSSSQGDTEVNKIVGAFGNGLLSPGSTETQNLDGTPSTGARVSDVVTGQLLRGSKDNPDEDSWECILRLAQAVNFVVFTNLSPYTDVFGDYLYFTDYPGMMGQQPKAILQLSSDGTQFIYIDPATGERMGDCVSSLDYTTDQSSLTRTTVTINGKVKRGPTKTLPQTPMSIQLNVLARPFEYNAGDSILILDTGVIDGTWAIEDSTMNTINDTFAQLTLVPPTAPLPEPLATEKAQMTPGSGSTSNTSNGGNNNSTPSTGATGGVWPFAKAKNLTFGRIDMGVDYDMTPGSPILAPYPCKYLGLEPNWYASQPYIAFEITDGPYKGKVFYIAEQINPPPWKVNQMFNSGDPLALYALNGTGIETGWANPDEWQQTLAQKDGTYTHDGVQTPEGQSYFAFLESLKNSSPSVKKPGRAKDKAASSTSAPQNQGGSFSVGSNALNSGNL